MLPNALAPAAKRKERDAAVSAVGLLGAFAPLFYTCKLLGIYPHEFDAFQARGTLQASRTGSLVVLAMLILVMVAYLLMVFMFRDVAVVVVKTDLGFIISAVLTFSGPLVMAVDQLNAIRKQQHLGKLFKRIHQLDVALAAQDIPALRYEQTAMAVRILMGLTVGFELVIFCSTYACYVGFDEWVGFLWIMSSVPTLYNSFDKIWFIGLTLALKRRYGAINAALDRLAAQHIQLKEDLKTTTRVPLRAQQWALGNHELAGAHTSSLTVYKAPVGQSKAKVVQPQQRCNVVQFSSELGDFALIEERFMRLCQLHGDLCDLVKRLNAHWSLPILSLMAYGFVVTIAQFYFFYAARWDDAVPSQFVSANNAIITTLFIVYLTGKCVTIMFASWKCTLEGKQTGICLHRCALAANRHEIYELVNHLSLKLLNHPVDFSAGGFFRLDMNNLYGILGGLTSYLIIFIQFDLEAKQQKANQLQANASRTTTTTTAWPLLY